LIGRLDHNFGWLDGRLVEEELGSPSRPAPRACVGALAAVAEGGGGGGGGTAGCRRVVRDPLGLNKLFWSRADDDILLAARPARLTDAGCAFDTIFSFPRGSVVDLDVERERATVHELRLGHCERPARNIHDLVQQIRARLHRWFESLARAVGEAPVFVCLSGGLDSAGIGVLARSHFPNTVAVSFDIERATGYVSEDRRIAERLAADLGFPLLRATASGDEILASLDTVLVEGIDWREFNVHAALVNDTLARAIAARLDGSSPARALVLTGDLMNEFLVDYAAVPLNGKSYYRLPRLEPRTLRDFLIRGLETSHRETGPFERYGLSLVQPYAVAADLLMALPTEILSHPDRKTRLMRAVFGARIPSYVYGRAKTRAQVGDGKTGTGVLGLCADRGIDEHWTRRRFAELHGVASPAALDAFIRAGRYRSGIPFSEAAPV
jgi:asparagine synthetase B (glutamine-hydrolysing)